MHKHAREKYARSCIQVPSSGLSIINVHDRAYLTFEIAFTAIPPDPGDGDDESLAVCRQCGGLVGIFPDRGLRWQHFRGDAITSGVQQVCDLGHAPEVTWILPDEDPDDL
jgi:hypothetical protein